MSSISNLSSTQFGPPGGMSSAKPDVVMTNTGGVDPVAVPKREIATGFGEILSNFVGDVNTNQIKANKSIEKLATGRTENLHETVIAMTKAETSLRYMMEVRSRIVTAYQEIQRMQV